MSIITYALFRIKITQRKLNSIRFCSSFKGWDYKDRMGCQKRLIQIQRKSFWHTCQLFLSFLLLLIRKHLHENKNCLPICNRNADITILLRKKWHISEHTFEFSIQIIIFNASTKNEKLFRYSIYYYTIIYIHSSLKIRNMTKYNLNKNNSTETHVMKIC